MRADSRPLPLESRVAPRGDLTELGFHGIADIQAVDEGLDGALVDYASCTGQSLESFLRVRVAFTAENRLDGFGYDCPVTVQVCLESIFIENKLAEAFLKRRERDKPMR